MVVSDFDEKRDLPRSILTDLDNEPPLIVEPNRMLMDSVAFEPLEVVSASVPQVPFVCGRDNRLSLLAERLNDCGGPFAAIAGIHKYSSQLVIAEFNVHARPHMRRPPRSID